MVLNVSCSVCNFEVSITQLWPFNEIDRKCHIEPPGFFHLRTDNDNIQRHGGQWTPAGPHFYLGISQNISITL
jgi:hypothetical protein